MKVCQVCEREYVGTNGKRVCSVECMRTLHNEYQARTVEAKCSVCGEWREAMYRIYAQNKRRRGGACPDCPPGDASAAEWRPYAGNAFANEPLIKWREPDCDTCRHGVVEPLAWNGYKCMANAVVCQPRLTGRLYVRR